MQFRVARAHVSAPSGTRKLPKIPQTDGREYGETQRTWHPNTPVPRLFEAITKDTRWTPLSRPAAPSTARTATAASKILPRDGSMIPAPPCGDQLARLAVYGVPLPSDG